MEDNDGIRYEYLDFCTVLTENEQVESPGSQERCQPASQRRAGLVLGLSV